MMVTVSHLPSSSGSLPIMLWVGVSWYLPPKGITTLPAPMLLSNISTKPFWEQTFKSLKVFNQSDLN